MEARRRGLENVFVGISNYLVMVVVMVVVLYRAT